MGAAKKFEMAPDEVYIQAALREGRATLQNEVSMKALGKPDVRFQARVKHLDMDHVHRLDMILQHEGKLSPVVIFRASDGKKFCMILADGFHRHEVYRRAKRDVIRAYVVDVSTDQIEHEARLFAAMCNQNLSLGRKPQDIRKAVELLFADPECWTWADKKIANHCGAGATTVRKWRILFSEANGIDIPDRVVDSRGVERTYRTVDSTGIPSVSQRKDTKRKGKLNEFRCHIGNKEYCLGTNITKEEAKTKALEIYHKEKTDHESRKRSLEIATFYRFLGSRLIDYTILRKELSMIESVNGLKLKGVLLCLCDFSDKRDVPWAFGALHAIRELAGNPGDRLVVVCYREDGPPKSIELFSKLGVEFLTPDELAASLKADQPADAPSPP